MTMDDVLRRIQKLDNHARNAAEVGSMAEAESYAAMVQKLLTQYRLSMSQVQMHELDEQEPVGRHVLNWYEYDMGAKRRQGWVEALAHFVCPAFHCRFLVHKGNNAITLVGREHNRKVCEFVLVTLVRTAESLAHKEYKRFRAKARREGRKEDSWGFKASFLESFTLRIKQRLEEQARENNESDTNAIVLVRTELHAVDEFIGGMKTGTAKSMVKWGGSNAAGWARGREVADGVDLRGRALETNGDGVHKELA